MIHCLVTGANGFIGRALCQILHQSNYKVSGTVRDLAVYYKPAEYLNVYATGNIGAHTDWRLALKDVDILFHLAGTVHRPDITDPQVYQTAITDATEALADQAIQSGVGHFIYLSTSHVYGVDHSEKSIHESHLKLPTSAYGKAKAAAEEKLLNKMDKTEMGITIVRPPLVYGRGVRGNFAQLVKWVQRLPVLPFGGATAKRSYVGLENLVAFLLLCARHDKSKNALFNVTDQQDLSTAELCEKIAHALGIQRKLLKLNSKWFEVCLKAIGQRSTYNKLFQSVRLDTAHAQSLLNWRPPFSVEQQLSHLLRA